MISESHLVAEKALIHLVKRVNEIDKLRKLIVKPSFNSFKIFNDNLIAVHMHKDILKLNHPNYVGMSILDLSKHLMYDFYYNKLKKQYPTCKLLYTDTDSFILKIETDDFYRDMKQTINLYDTSNYSKEHYLFSNKNKKVLGYSKTRWVEFQLVSMLDLGLRCTLLLQKKNKLEKRKELRKI